MRINCDRKSLLAAVTRVAGVPRPNSPKPILANLLLRVDEDGPVGKRDYTCSLLATDLEVGVQVRVSGVQADGPGLAVLPTARVKQALGLMRSEQVVIDIDDDRNEIRLEGDAKHEFPGMNPDEFPAVPPFDFDSYYVVPSADLRRAVRRAVIAVDPDTTRHSLLGCLFDFAERPGRLVVAGTDGRRIAEASVPCEAEGDPVPLDRPIVPPKSLKLLERMIDDGDPPVHLAFLANGSAVMVRTHDSTIYARLGEGRFPRYQKAFTSEPAHRFSVEAGPLADAVNQALVSVAGETLGVHWVFGPGRLTLWSRSADVGRSEASVAVDYAGDPVEIVLGGRYASEMLGVCGDVPVAVEFTDESRAVMFRLDDGYVHALYPVNSGVAAQKEAVGTPAKVKKMSEKVARAMAAS